MAVTSTLPFVDLPFVILIDQYQLLRMRILADWALSELARLAWMSREQFQLIATSLAFV
jgi:hypothetical protein